MRPFCIVKRDPIGDSAAGVRQAFKTLSMNALLLQRTNKSLHHTVLLRTVGRDELLFEAIAFDQSGVLARGEDQSIVAAQQKRRLHPPQCSEPSDQRMF